MCICVCVCLYASPSCVWLCVPYIVYVLTFSSSISNDEMWLPFSPYPFCCFSSLPLLTGFFFKFFSWSSLVYFLFCLMLLFFCSIFFSFFLFLFSLSCCFLFYSTVNRWVEYYLIFMVCNMCVCVCVCVRVCGVCV